MPLPGPPPKPADQKRHRIKPPHEWIEVENRPYNGPVPELPERPRRGCEWHERTLEWWGVISRMPHCILWDDGDWQFAIDTASVAAVFHDNTDLRAAVELRQREKLIGMTWDARRDLRIRYVDRIEEKADPVIVSAMDEYRRAAS